MTSNRRIETQVHTNRNPTLRSWQAAPPRDRRLGLKVLMTLSLFIAVALFSYSLRKPFAGAELQVLILGPASSEKFTLENVLNADLANLLARANADLVSNSIEQLQAPLALTFETDRTLRRTENEIETALANQVHSDATLMVYVSGVLTVDRHRPCLCETAREATSLGNTFDILSLVQSLQALRCKHVMLSIDAVMPSVDVQGQVAASQAWDGLSDEIEELLLQSDRTPIVIQLGLSWIDKEKSSATTSKLARMFSSVFQDEFLVARPSLFDLQCQLAQAAMGDQERNAVAEAAQTLVSANWPLDSRTYVYPQLKAKPSAVAPSLASEGRRKPERKEAFEKCASIFAKWQVSADASTPTSLRFPSAVSWQAASRYAYHCLHDACQVLHIWDSLMPRELDDEVVQDFAECLRRLDQLEPLPAGSPSWLQPLPGTLAATANRSSSSLVTNAMFTKLGMLTRQDDDQSDRYLEELLDLIAASSASSTAALAEWFNQLPKGVNDCVEAQWCAEVLEQPDVNWDTQRLFIQAKLLSMRVASDPLAADACSQLLACADKDRISAERTLQDRDQQDWLTRCTRLIRQAIGGYEQAMVELERHRSLQADYDQKFAAIQSTDVIQVLDPNERQARMRDYCLRWSDALSPWNSDLAQQWAAHSKTYGPLAAKDSSIESQIRSSVEFDHFTHSRLEQLNRWLQSHASSIPKCSGFWVFAKQHWTSKHDDLARIVQKSEEHLSQTMQSNVERLERERYGATSAENAELDEQLRWWLALSNQRPMTHRASPPALNIDSDAELDLIAQGEVQTRVAIRSSSSAESPIQLQAMFDDSAIEVAIDGQAIAAGEAVSVVTRASARTIDSQPIESTSVPIVVRRRNREATKQPIMLVATHGSEQRRALIRLNAPHAPMVECQISNKRFMQLSATANNAVLLPNQTNPLAISLRNLQQACQNYSLKVYSLSDEGVTPPAGSVAIDDAQQWLSSIGSPVAVACCESLPLASGQSKEAPLVQSLLPVDQPPPSVRTLLVAIATESQKQMQFVTWTPRALHPTQYIQPTVNYDADRKTVVIRSVASMPTAIAADGTLVEIELLSIDHLQSIAYTQSRIYPGKLESEVTLSTASCKANRALLIIAVDGWQSSFLYELDLRSSGAIELSKSFAALRLQTTSPTSVAALDAKDVEFQVDALLNDATFDPGRDVIKVGFDLNRNRSLVDDATMQLKGTRSVRFVLGGVTKAGEICLQPEVQSYRVKLPAAVEWNQRLNAMAELQSGVQVTSSNSVPVVFDRQPSRVTSVRLMGSIPALLGTPLVAEVQVSDGELSGVANVEGAWSLSGEVEIGASMKAVPAVYREGDRWLLTMPTDVLPSGKSLLLVRARDQAGNVSKAYTVVAELLTQAELAARAASFTTSVRGDVFFSKTPLPKIDLRLVEKLEAKEVTKAQEPKVIASASTDEQGRFQLSNVPTGSYDLELSGIVRGMRVKQVRSVMIDAQSLTPEIHFRLDQKQ